MKKIILSFVAIMALSIANAQESKTEFTGFKKGDVIITGSFGLYNNEIVDVSKLYGYFIEPKAGYFISNNFAFGLGLNILNQSEQQNQQLQIKESNRIGFVAFGRYYFKPKNKFSFFGEAQFSYDTIKTKPALSTSNGFRFNLSPGFNYFLTDNFSIESSIGLISYSSNTSDNIINPKQTSFNIGLNLSNIGFGVLYKF